MVEILKARDVTLAQLSEKFGLERSDDENFFREWQDDLPELNQQEKQALDEVKTEYLYLSKYPLLEPIVQMVVLAPLLKLSGFYRPPFYLAAEKEIEITSEDEGTIIRGKIDVLIFQPQFWVLVIEAKKAEFSLEAAIPQALVYMLANPDINKPTFGFVTNGNEFQFLKLTRQVEPRYGRSYPLSIYRGDDIYSTLSGLKRLRELVI
ncbi:MAG: restriction endonuclease subunit R [Calothrix sp. C42_A2020_038]|nr:restriction endonuclease subunit R [Calothrix sp. C42_A2020_038]